MIIIKLEAGLGNQMFQYALGRNLAIKNNCELMLDKSWYKKLKYKYLKYKILFKDINQIFRSYNLNKFNINAKEINQSEIEKIKNNLNIIYENKRDFDPEILKLRDNTMLVGFWEKEKYFDEIRDVLLKDFTLRDVLDIVNKRREEEILSKSNAVSIHFRLGDMKKFGRSLVQIKYYYNAVEYISNQIKNPHFYIFSEEPEWVKKNFKIDFPFTYITGNDCFNNYKDIYLISKCKHHIISNSTFSWWGAWLSTNEKKILVAPKVWRKPEDAVYEYYKNFISERWVKV